MNLLDNSNRNLDIRITLVRQKRTEYTRFKQGNRNQRETKA